MLLLLQLLVALNFGVVSTHDCGGSEKKRGVFPQKAEFGASVASSFVQPATPHPPDGEGLGLL